MRLYPIYGTQYGKNSIKINERKLSKSLVLRSWEEGVQKSEKFKLRSVIRKKYFEINKRKAFEKYNGKKLVWGCTQICIIKV